MGGALGGDRRDVQVSVVREGVERGAGRTGVCRLSWHELMTPSRKGDWLVWSLPWMEERSGYTAASTVTFHQLLFSESRGIRKGAYMAAMRRMSRCTM